MQFPGRVWWCSNNGILILYNSPAGIAPATVIEVNSEYYVPDVISATAITNFDGRLEKVTDGWITGFKVIDLGLITLEEPDYTIKLSEYYFDKYYGIPPSVTKECLSYKTSTYIFEQFIWALLLNKVNIDTVEVIAKSNLKYKNKLYNFYILFGNVVQYLEIPTIVDWVKKLSKFRKEIWKKVSKDLPRVFNLRPVLHGVSKLDPTETKKPIRSFIYEDTKRPL